jgi:hypothetical protein
MPIDTLVIQPANMTTQFSTRQMENSPWGKTLVRPPPRSRSPSPASCTDAEVITTIPAGSRVRVTDCSGEWCMVTWNGRSGFAIARNLDIGGAHARSYRAPPGYAGGPPSGYPDGPPAVYEAGPPVIYGPPAYYPPPVVVYGPRYYYGARYYGWRRRW